MTEVTFKPIRTDPPLVADIVGEDFRFHARSDTYAAFPWLVDLESHGGAGECQCPDWQIKRRKFRKDGETDFLKVRCKHEKRCLAHYARREIRKRLGETFDLAGVTKNTLIKWALADIKARIAIARKMNRNKSVRAEE